MRLFFDLFFEVGMVEDTEYLWRIISICICIVSLLFGCVGRDGNSGLRRVDFSFGSEE